LQGDAKTDTAIGLKEVFVDTSPVLSQVALCIFVANVLCNVNILYSWVYKCSPLRDQTEMEAPPPQSAFQNKPDVLFRLTLLAVHQKGFPVVAKNHGNLLINI